MQFRAVFKDLMLDVNANKIVADFVTRKIRESGEGPGDRGGAHRLSTTTTRPSARSSTAIISRPTTATTSHLADVRKAAPIEAITPDGIRTADGALSTSWTSSSSPPVMTA